MCEIDHWEINFTSVNRFMIIFMSSQTELHADKCSFIYQSCSQHNTVFLAKVWGGWGENGDVCENVMWILSINLIKTSPIIV